MLLVKKSSKNQIALPKAILERAGVGPEDAYFTVDYVQGAITLRPVEVHEKLSPEALARFEARVLKREPGDRVYGSMEALICNLHRHRRTKA